MARLIHMSDLHFGAHEPKLVEAVEAEVRDAKPDLVVVSGDFTQRARTEQFQEACRFLERLREAGHDVIGVPGNHDVPLYDVFRRFFSPLTRYKRFVGDVLCPYIELPGVAVLGINTARSLTFTEGRINHEQMEMIRETFARADSAAMKVLVTHHPLLALPVGEGLAEAVGRSELALDAVADAGVDLLLAGHHHRVSTYNARDLATRAGPALVIQAGTATSHRVRDEVQSFNSIEIDGKDVKLTIHTWAGERFVAADAQRFRREGDRWRLAASRVEEHSG